LGEGGNLEVKEKGLGGFFGAPGAAFDSGVLPELAIITLHNTHKK
jgi:hypothetical protein